MKSVLVIDGHRVYRHGLRRMIEIHFAEYRAMEAGSLDEPVVAATSFDLMLIDAASLDDNSPGILQGVQAINPQTRFAVMSNSQVRADVFKFLSAGFHGFLSQTAARRRIADWPR